MDVKAACAAYKDKDGRKPTLENAKPFEEFVAKNGLAVSRRGLECYLVGAAEAGRVGS
jgi:hypothetical protein